MAEFFSGYVIWLIVGLIIMFLEYEFPGFIIFFFGLGAWVTAFLIFFGLIESIDAKLLSWIISSVILLIFLRKFVKNIFTGFISKKDSGEKLSDDFVGKNVEVAETTGPDYNVGKVKFQGSYWKAVSEKEKKPGEKGTILSKENITLTIE